jgi:hypothetical protein
LENERTGDHLVKKLFTYRRIYILLLIPVSFLLLLLAKNSSFFAEQVFARHVYRWIAQIYSTVTGILPFSLAELIVLLLPFIILIIILRFIIRLIKIKTNRRERIVKGILNVICTGSIVLFLFTIFAGLNYYRYTFAEYSGLEITESSVEELYGLTESLMLKANELREQIPHTDEEGVFKLSMSNRELAKEAEVAYESMAKEYAVLGGFYGAAKPVLFSSLMSNTEITGIFFPFTMEANVNVDIPDYTIPATMMHEMAHLRGFMREDEANYLAYLVGSESDNIELQYSSTMHALVNASNALYDQNPDLYFEIRHQYSEGVLKDIRANSAYWVQFEDSVVSTVSNKINDTYLKVNAQTDGVKSYGRMLDLLLAKYRKESE